MSEEITLSTPHQSQSQSSCSLENAMQNIRLVSLVTYREELTLDDVSSLTSGSCLVFNHDDDELTTYMEEEERSEEMEEERTEQMGEEERTELMEEEKTEEMDENWLEERKRSKKKDEDNIKRTSGDVFFFYQLPKK